MIPAVKRARNGCADLRKTPARGRPGCGRDTGGPLPGGPDAFPGPHTATAGPSVLGTPAPPCKLPGGSGFSGRTAACPPGDGAWG
ncbi:uncharacterized protein STAUR_4339 [Stigmatella aurantiaca DW4/3-1]|uniref:Uncharacterized protein n=1 Tax=Stigmatella aurantiaca (strain DW4/3-1) TaxID=378806 RepID=E3FSK8_STIAD|nr:uncharacterized protein STAUR_4339 [Stigmatella aurantiaca DW4/3-1]